MTTREELDVRYGRTTDPRRRRMLWTIVIAVAAAVVVAGSWMILSANATSVRADDTAMRVVDDHTVEIGFQVSGPTNREIACALQALDEEFGVVGWRVVVLPASSEHTRAFTETIRTLSTATTGLVNSCWVA